MVSAFLASGVSWQIKKWCSPVGNFPDHLLTALPYITSHCNILNRCYLNPFIFRRPHPDAHITVPTTRRYELNLEWRLPRLSVFRTRQFYCHGLLLFLVAVVWRLRARSTGAFRGRLCAWPVLLMNSFFNINWKIDKFTSKSCIQ